MEVVWRNIDEIKPYEDNPRKNDEAVEAVANSIKAFGWNQPIVVDRDGVIIAGHTRYKAAKKLGLEQVPTLTADHLTDAEAKAYRLADNKTAELAEWDIDKLEKELAELAAEGFPDMSDFGFLDAIDPDEAEETESKYTQKIDIPQYQITGECPDLSELIDTGKCNALIAEIEDSGLDEDEKEFLRMAAYRHLAFDYKRVAEYYAHASEEMQELMERSALVIIDYNDALRNGYIKLTEALQDIIGGDE